MSVSLETLHRLRTQQEAIVAGLEAGREMEEEIDANQLLKWQFVNWLLAREKQLIAALEQKGIQVPKEFPMTGNENSQ